MTLLSPLTIFTYCRLGHFKKDKPIILDIGGEASLIAMAHSRGEEVGFSSLLVELSKQHGAALLSVEHRYYGSQNGYPSSKTQSLKWLTTE